MKRSFSRVFDLLELLRVVRDDVAFEAGAVGIEVTLQVATIITVAVLGIVAVAVAPLFTARRMRRMDLPGTLRLVE